MKLIFWAITLFAVISCKHLKQTDTISFIKDYPKTAGKDDTFHRINKRLTKYIGLDSITKRADSFTLRIWVEHALIVGVDLYEIKYVDNNWIGIHYYFQDKASDYSYVTKRDYYGLNDEIDSFWIAKKFKPLSGWNNFADTIINCGILTLPDYRDIPACKIGGVDGSTFVFEWANKNIYRYYTFWSHSNSSCTDNKTFQDFKTFLGRQLGLDYCWPKCWRAK